MEPFYSCCITSLALGSRIHDDSHTNQTDAFGQNSFGWRGLKTFLSKGPVTLEKNDSPPAVNERDIKPTGDTEQRAGHRTTSRSCQEQRRHMCCLAQKWSLCLLAGWLNAQHELFSWCQLRAAASTYGVGRGDRGVRSYRCGATKGHLAPRGRWDSSIAGRRWKVFLKNKGEQGTAGPVLTSWSFQESDRKMLPGPSTCLIFLFPDLSWLGSRARPSSVYYNFTLCSHLPEQL